MFHKLCCWSEAFGSFLSVWLFPGWGGIWGAKPIRCWQLPEWQKGLRLKVQIQRCNSPKVSTLLFLATICWSQVCLEVCMKICFFFLSFPRGSQTNCGEPLLYGNQKTHRGSLVAKTLQLCKWQVLLATHLMKWTNSGTRSDSWIQGAEWELALHST